MLEPGKRAASKHDERHQAHRFDELMGVADMEQAAANYESAIRSYRLALEAGPTLLQKVQGQKGIGICLERVGRWTEALGILEDAAASAREANSESDLGQILVKIGKIHLGRGDTESALDHGRRALELLDEHEDASSRGFALNLLGTALNQQGDLEKSTECFRSALSAFKEAGDIASLSLAYNNLGLICKERCDWKEAQEYLQVASSLQAIEGYFPRQRVALHNLGIVHFKMGHWDRARESFTAALDLAREINDPLTCIRTLLGLGGLHLVRRDWDQALETLEQALELCSEEEYPRESALIYRSLGQLHEARGDLGRAKRCLEVAWRKAVEIAPEGDLARELLRLRAQMALREGKLSEAASLAQRALELSRTTRDRMETALAHVVCGRVRAAEGDSGWTEDFDQAGSILRPLGSPLPLAQTLAEEGRLRLEAGEDLAAAETVLLEARRLYDGLGLTRDHAETFILLARVATLGNQLHRAGEYLEMARGVAEAMPEGVIAGLVEAQRDLESRLVDASVTNLGAFKTAGRLEEIIDSQKPYATKLSEVLQIMAQALEADGAAFVFTREGLDGATYRIGSVPGETLHRTLEAAQPERPEIVLHAETLVREPWNDVVRDRGASSLMVVPINGNGSAAYLYVDRLGETRRSSFGPSHLNLCLALGPQLESLIDRAFLEAVTLDEEDTLKRLTYLADVVTQNGEMIEILKLIEKVNRTDLTVLLQGETGTGKTLIARAIHNSSNRSGSSFITVDCAALPGSLLESELFGYVKGAFTGATHDKKGLFEEADGGTIFLDEVGKAGLEVQRNLLHLLDKGEVRPVGANAYRQLNVRVICATSKDDLLHDNEDGPFIKDLYFRLNDIILRVPPLRDRVEDIPLLTDYFLATFNGTYGREAADFTRQASQRLLRYGWPGNVRELEKVIRRAAILADDAQPIGVDLLPREVIEATETGTGSSGGEDAHLQPAVEALERQLIIKALKKHQGNKTRAAVELDISRKGLKNKITRYGLTLEF